MKRLILIVFTFTGSIVYSQSMLDKLILVNINDYRAKKNLEKLEFSSVAYKAAEHHNIYLNDNPDQPIAHHEDNETPSHWHRLKKYNDRNDGNFWRSAENLWGAMQIEIDLNEETDQLKKLAKEAVKDWIKSPGHKKNLLLGQLEKAAIHSIVTDNNRLIVTYVAYRYY